jgi:signal peptidase I
MLETYHDHQPVIIYKRDDNHEVGEVLTFEYTQDLEENASEISGASSSAVVGNQHVKRVVAVAGDHVVIKEDNLYVNDILVSESSNTLVEQDYIVEENEVFVAGDNIDESYDSRYHGTIKIENITGVVITGDDNQAYNN